MSYNRRLGRNDDYRWQWLIMGALMGFGCAGVSCLIAVTAGMINLNLYPTPTQLAGDLARSPAPTVCGPIDEVCGTPNITDSGPPAASAATQPAAGAAAPTTPEEAEAPPETENTQTAAQATTTTIPTQAPTNTIPPSATPAPTEAAIDPRLANVVTELVPVAGGENIEMGTNQTEAAIAVQECVNAGGNCQISYAEDSFPVHTVKLSSFQIERYEVTVGQFAAFLNTLGPNGHKNGCGGAQCAATQSEDGTSPIQFDGTTYASIAYHENRPVTNVTWFGADAYCKAIGRRLPTEAEWERAARGPTPASHTYPWGSTFDSNLTNTSQNVGGTTEVGSYPDGASPFGAEDMAGNVAEWVYDWYQIDYYSTTEAQELDPQGPLAGTERVIRGGAWDQRPFFARTVHRMSAPPNDQNPSTGFRCVSEESPPPTAIPAAPAEAPPTEAPTADPNVTPTELPTLPPGGG